MNVPPTLRLGLICRTMGVEDPEDVLAYKSLRLAGLRIDRVQSLEAFGGTLRELQLLAVVPLVGIRPEQCNQSARITDCRQPRKLAKGVAGLLCRIRIERDVHSLSSGAVQVHMRTHATESEEKPFCCGQCGAR